MTIITALLRDLGGTVVAGAPITVTSAQPVPAPDGLRAKPLVKKTAGDGSWSVDLVGGRVYTFTPDRADFRGFAPLTVFVPEAGTYNLKDLVPAEDGEATTFKSFLDGKASSGRVSTLEQSAATVEELVAQGGIFTQAATGSMVVFVPGIACRIISAALVVYGNSGGMIAADDANYWDLRMCRNRAGAGNAFAIKTTKATGGQAITHRVAWDYNTVAFDPVYRDLAAGDIVTIEMYKTGAPNPLTNLLVALRYSPL